MLYYRLMLLETIHSKTCVTPAIYRVQPLYSAHHTLPMQQLGVTSTIPGTLDRVLRMEVYSVVGSRLDLVKI
jgi:hypothetical protein